MAPAGPGVSRHLEDAEVVEEELSVAGDGGRVVLQQAADAAREIDGAVLQGQPPGRHQVGRVRDEPARSVHHFGEPAAPHVSVPVEGHPEPSVPPQLAHVGLREPDLEVRHGGEAADRLAVGAGAAEQDGAALRRRETVLPPRHRQARQQPLDVPLPRAGVRLVEVTDVEHEPSRRRLVEAEVAEVGIAVQLDHDPGRGRAGEVVGHHRGGTLEEREGRGRHPRRAQRDQVRDPIEVLPVQQDGGRGAEGRHDEVRVAGQGARRAGGPPQLMALGAMREVALPAACRRH